MREVMRIATSVAPHFKRFAVRNCALLLGCLLAQPGAFARSDRDSIFFQPASLQGSDSFSAAASVMRVQRAETAFTNSALVPMTDSTSIRALIANLEEGGDFHSSRIGALSEQLGSALQAAGQHGAALEAYDRSFQINRRLEGLSSATQVSILQAEINSQLALGDFEATDALHYSLFSMQQRLLAEHPVALAEANLFAADWNLQYYLQLKQAPVPGGRTEGQDAALAARLGDAFMQYHKALWLLSTSAADDLYEQKVVIERKIAALTLMVDRQRQQDIPNTLTKLGQNSVHQSRSAHDPALFNHGSAALQRAVDYSVANAEPMQIAERQLELADWYLLMDQQDEARTTYASAVASLRDAGIAEPQIAAMLESGLPVHDPETALLATGARQAVGDFDGYIDVSFDLNRYGKASNTRVLAGASYDEQIEEELLRQIHDGRFRPGFDQGSPVDRTDVTLRYYFARQ
jgi:hypothetical protein